MGLGSGRHSKAFTFLCYCHRRVYYKLKLWQPSFWLQPSSRHSEILKWKKTFPRTQIFLNIYIQLIFKRFLFFVSGFFHPLGVFFCHPVTKGIDPKLFFKSLSFLAWASGALGFVAFFHHVWILEPLSICFLKTFNFKVSTVLQRLPFSFSPQLCKQKSTIEMQPFLL